MLLFSPLHSMLQTMIFPISLLQRANSSLPGVWTEAQGSLHACPRPHRWRSHHQLCLRAWASQPTGSTQPAVDSCQVTAAPGCEKKPGLVSRPANKLVAICIPFHDSAVLYERIYCGRSRRLEGLKEETAEERYRD